MPTTRRRPESEFESTQSQSGLQIDTLASFTGGINGYTSAELLSPQFWAPGTYNVYAGQFGTVRRARWAPLVNSSTSGYTPTTVRMTSMYGAYFFGQNPWLFYDTNGVIWWLNSLSSPVAKQLDQTLSLFYLPAWNLTGPFMRLGMGGTSMLFQTNGSARSKILVNQSTNQPNLELDGIDAPDTSPNVAVSNNIGGTGGVLTISAISRTSNVVTCTTTANNVYTQTPGYWVTVAGVTDTTFNSPAGVAYQIISILPGNTFTFKQVGPDASDSTGTIGTGITTSVGRSYAYALENVNTGHVSAPSPASNYASLTGGVAVVTAIPVGTITATINTPNIVGTNTAFTQAWVGRKLATSFNPGSGWSTDPYIASVQDATHMTVSANSTTTSSGLNFFVYDPQVTHIRFYATGDGQAVYMRIARNALVFTSGRILLNAGYAAAGIQYSDQANSNPPNAPFTNELAQYQNVPPPIGKFQDAYQGRRINYGVTAAPQSFFFSNVESTVVGQPPESYAPLNEVTLPIGDGQMFGTANLPTGFVIWSNRQDMFKLTGTLTDNTIANAQQLGASIQRLPYRIGCASPYATCVTSLGAFWLSSDREVWLFTDHYAPKNVGKPIQDVLNRINGSRLQFAKMKNYKAGDRNWLLLAIALDNSGFNNQLCALDLDLLASNGQPSFFTFDMASNQPSWYLYNTNCEAIEAAFDSMSINHLLAGDVDLITDLDWQPAYYTVSAEQTVNNSLILHAIGNQDPEIIKTMKWVRCNTNARPQDIISQGWSWSILSYDDDKYILGINPRTTPMIPGVNNPAAIFGLEYSPALFKFGGVNFAKGRRFQLQASFPTSAGLYEMRSFQVAYDQITAR